MRHHQKRFLILFIILIGLLIFGLIYFLANYKNPRNVISSWLAESVKAEELTREYIQDFQVSIRINNDNSVDVSERIVYNFGDWQRHGIVREIPYKYKAKGGNFAIKLKVQSVINESGRSYYYQAAKDSGKVSIKIGDPDKYVSGPQTYIINYQLDRVINFFDDYDEFYWNVTGNDWQAPIDRAGVAVKLPQFTNAEDIQAQCFTGSFGSKEQNCSVTNVSNSQIGYSVFKTMAPGEGLTIVLGWPKGILLPPSFISQIKWIMADNPLMLLPILSLLVMFLLWYFHGRDLGKITTIIPYYQPPLNLLPAEVGSVIDERVNLVDISSTIIDLAVKGFIKIKEAGRNDWEFIKLREFEGLKIWEKKFAEAIFDSKPSVKISELKNNFYRHLADLKKEMYKDLVEKNFFTASPQKIRTLYIIAAFILLCLGMVVIPFFGGGFNILFLVLSAVVIFWLGQYMPYKTKEGTKAVQEIKGYKRYLAVAEKERIKFHNAPEKKPEEFEKHLSYAMVLGVEKKWAQQFKDIYLQKPSWYEGRFATFNSLIFVSSLNNLNYNAKSVLASKPLGAASGSSGFSGGGFGGGGGGSW
ncbi:DUF2207 domain-containing protein [Patescibacteria group bacterium]|nr:DUF2207 domain-containing protein [Patescibacteria group bacterium]